MNHENEITRRLAAAYVSYIAGNGKGLDIVLDSSPEQIDMFWKELAAFVVMAMARRLVDNLKLCEVVTGYIHKNRFPNHGIM